MKALLIKTDDKTIEEVDFDGTLEHAYKLLDVRIVERVTLDNGDDVWVDEEGLLNETRKKGFFQIQWHNLAGRGLITGNVYNPEEGEEFAPVKTTLEEAKEEVFFA